MAIKLHKWQTDLIKKFGTDGGQSIMTIAMGRQMGKSQTLQWAKTLEQFVQGFRMEASEGTVLGQTYYCVKPLGWIWRDFEWRDMQAWCEETMGPTPKDGTWTPNQRWYVNSEQFWFREEADRTMFMMKWI